MSEPQNKPIPANNDKQDERDEPKVYKDDGIPKGTCSACMMTFPVTAILVIDKQARCPSCGAWFVGFNM